MSKKKASKKPKAPAKKKETKAPKEELVVFAFRLTQEERALIHKAAGPSKASKFVCTLAVAAANRDEKAVRSADCQSADARSADGPEEGADASASGGKAEDEKQAAAGLDLTLERIDTEGVMKEGFSGQEM